MAKQHQVMHRMNIESNMRAILIALVCIGCTINLLASASMHSDWLSWSKFKREHEKNYVNQAEEAARFANFLTNTRFIERHNAKAPTNFTLRLNHMADWSASEIAQLNGFKCGGQQLEYLSHKDLEQILHSDDPVPAELDWRKVEGRVTAVKEQGKCASDWAFATTGLLEGQEKLRNMTSLVSLSEQELIDCSSSCKGCIGGYMAGGLDDIALKLGGVEPEKDYAYEAASGKCRLDKNKFVFTTQGHKMLPKGDEDTLKKVVASYGPVAVAFEATDNTIWYTGGVLDDELCKEKLNHGALIVGYGKDPQQGDFWIVKNSWGPKWGEAGYMRMKRGVNQCGIAEMPTIANF